MDKIPKPIEKLQANQVVHFNSQNKIKIKKKATKMVIF